MKSQEKETEKKEIKFDKQGYGYELIGNTVVIYTTKQDLNSFVSIGVRGTILSTNYTNKNSFRATDKVMATYRKALADLSFKVAKDPNSIRITRGLAKELLESKSKRVYSRSFASDEFRNLVEDDLSTFDQLDDNPKGTRRPKNYALEYQAKEGIEIQALKNLIIVSLKNQNISHEQFLEEIKIGA